MGLKHYYLFDYNGYNKYYKKAIAAINEKFKCNENSNELPKVLKQYGKVNKFHSKLMNIIMKKKDTKFDLNIINDFISMKKKAIIYIKFETIKSIEPNDRYRADVIKHLDNIKMVKEEHGEYNEKLISMYYELGGCYYKMGQFEKAIDSHNSSIDIVKKRHGKDISEYVYIYNSLAYEYNELGIVHMEHNNYEGAEESFINSSNLLKEIYGNQYKI